MSNLTEKVQFLSDPGSYGGTDKHVEAHETHMSWIFMTDCCVFKLKKPVKHSFLDFSTLKKRQFFCEAQVSEQRSTPVRSRPTPDFAPR